MIIKDYFADGLLQIAIVLSLLRCDLDSFVDTSVRPLLGQSHLLETNIGPLSSITRTGLNFHSREFVREYPKALDSYNDRFTSVLRDLHSLNYYRRFDGISTNVYAWLVNDGGPVGSTSSSEPSTGNSADESNTATQNASPLPTAELSVIASEPNNMNLFLADDLSKEDMELINVLYLQDIDLGVGREAFDDLCSDSAVNTVERKEHEIKQALPTQDIDESHNDTDTSSAQQQSVDDSALSSRYVIDTETGELVLASSPTSETFRDQQSFSQSHNYEGESSYEERWEDMLSILDLQSVLEGDSISEVGSDWDNFTSPHNASSSTSSSALVHNVSMTLPIASTSVILSRHDTANVPPPTSYDLTPIHTEPLPFFQLSDFHMSSSSDAADVPSSVSLTCDTPLFNTSQFVTSNISSSHIISDVLDAAVSSHPTAPTIPDDNGTTLLSTMEHYSSASAALNEDLTQLDLGAASSDVVPAGNDISPSNSSVADTNALFHQLMTTNFLLDELDCDNTTFLERNLIEYDNWSSADSAVSSMHSPTLESAVDEPTGAIGFTNDMSSERSVPAATAAAGSISHGVKYTAGEFAHFFRDCSMRTAASNTSSNDSCRSTGSGSPSGVDRQKDVQHNHTYPLTPGQRSRSDREDDARREREAHATRCRDEKKAKDMQIPLTMDEMIDSSVEEFNELLSKYKLSEPQNQLIRDIRRRGKNKLAAQNCRKRKLEVIQTVEDELLELRRERDKLLLEKSALDRRSASLKQKFSSLEMELFTRLRNETGQDYDPRLYSVLQTDDGRMFIVPRENATSTSQQTPHDEQHKRKRKPDKKD